MATHPAPLRDALLQAIRESGLSCRELSRRTGIDTSLVNTLSQGDPFPLDAAESLAGALGLRLVRVPTTITHTPARENPLSKSQAWAMEDCGVVSRGFSQE